ncbi:hypothetical protein Tco_1429433 [Tanacetum coccineum]
MLSYSIRIMDPNSSLGKICLGENVVEILSDKVEGSGDWNSPEFQDTANSGQKKEKKAMVFHQMDTEEVSDRFMAPCFVNGLKAYDGGINLGVEENMILNEYAIKLCLEHEVKRGNKIVKKELIVALRAITDFGAGTITIYPDIDPVLEDTEEEEKNMDDWDHLLDFNLDDIPLLGGEELMSFVCKMRKRSSLSAGGHLTQEEAAKEALAIKISQKFALLEEVRHVIETMAYHDKYKKILNEIWKDKVELDGKIIKEEEEAIKRIKGETLKEKDDPEAFIFPIRLEGKVNENTLADTGSDINTMPYRIYETLGREEMKKVGVTTIIAMFLILDIPIDRDVLIMVGGGFLDSNDEEEYQIKRNKFGAPIYGPKPTPYLNCNDLAERSLALQAVINPFRKISVWKKAVSFLGSLPVPLKQVNWKPDYKGIILKKKKQQDSGVLR